MILDYEPSTNDVSSEGREKNSLKRQFTTLLNEVSRGGTGGGHVCLFQGWDRGTAKCKVKRADLTCDVIRNLLRLC